MRKQIEDTYTELKPYKGYGITKAVEYGKYDPLMGKIGSKKITHYDIWELNDPDWVVMSFKSLPDVKKWIDAQEEK